MPNSGATVLKFGVFELDAKTGELRKSGVLIHLPPQPIKVLALLASRPGELITREEIVKEVWSDTLVDFEHGLNSCVRQIRTALDDEADTPRYIETLPRRGYRFIFPMEKPPPQPKGERRFSRLAVWLGILALAAAVGVGGYFAWKWWAARGVKDGKVMLVVLPFKNLDPDPEQKYFSQGLTEEMITQLGRLQPERLGVIARTTAMLYEDTPKPTREIARELRVDYIVEGSVRRAGNRVRITAQLIQTGDDTHLWAETYDRALEDVLAIQGDVARRVADSLALELLPERSVALGAPASINPAAYDAYLKGRYQWNKRSPQALLKSIEFYQEALAADPDNALAHAGLADSYMLLGSTPYDVFPARDAVVKGKAAAERALALDDSLAEAHNALAHALLFYDWDWAGAERSFRRAIELNPGYATAHHWYAEYLWLAGRMDEALEQVRRARELEPYSLVFRVSEGRHHYLVGEYDQAIARFQETVEFEPGFFLSYFGLGVALTQAQRHAEAIAALEKAVELSGRLPMCLAGLAAGYARAGRAREARALLAELERLRRQRPVQALYLAGVYAALGEKDTAFDWLDKAHQERSSYLIHVGRDPLFAPLRSDARFQGLLRRLGLPQ